MIGYTDATYSSTLHAPATPSKAASPLLDQTKITYSDKRTIPVIQLTPLWEHVVRTQSVPKDVNLDDIFQALNERLRNPEWEVRQHALRVLVDVIPVMGDELDQKMELLLGDLVGNLGHPGPAVRKGALDSLKMYLTHSSHSEDILRNIVYRGIEKHSENQLPSDVVVGIILSLPSLFFPGHTSHSTIEYIVNSLINKLVQVTFQEVSLRSLCRIRDAIGVDEFNTILENAQPNSRRDFELLCQVYDTHGQKIGFNLDHNGTIIEDERSKWNDLNANIIPDNRWQSDSDSVGILSPDENGKLKEDTNNKRDNENNVPSGKVILETEIQFNSSTAVTMKILEEGTRKDVNDSDSDDDNDDCVVKVFSDSDNEEIFELRRRTPRRVRFGGEIVKLRTPDSDSNHPSDLDNDITITTTSNNDSNNPVIEIKFITDERKKYHRSRSLIPVPIYSMGHKLKARSLPTSPNRKVDLNSKSRLLYQSHPNLTRAHFFSNQKQSTKTKVNNNLRIQIPKKLQNHQENPTVLSPVMPHREIELLHNLTRSPTRIKPEHIFEEAIKPTTIERPLSTADFVSSTAKQPQQSEKRKILTADSENIKTTPPNKIPQAKVEPKREQSLSSIEASDNDLSPGRTYSSFILKDSASEGIQSDSYVPNNDSGDCLTCSSSGSEGVQADSSWEASGIVNKTIIESMHEKDDLRTKLRGFEMFGNELRRPEILQKFQPFLGPLLHFLFNAERHPRLQGVAEELLKTVLKNSSPETIKQCLPQLSMSLSKMGSPAGIRLGIIVMQKISAKALVQHILEEPIMSSRSAKTREGAMQLMVCATTTFPSTEFDVATTAEKVALVATDRKRRVRQATLDVLAVLAQLGQPTVVMEAVSKAVRDLPDRDGLLAAVRFRLTRRQLPIVEPDGTIINASPGIGHGADIEWVAAGSGSMSPCSARSKRRAMTPATTNQNTNRNESATQSQRNLWSARKYPDSSDPFGTSVDNSENLTWALVPYKKDESQNKAPPPTQLWAIENPGTNGDKRFNGSGSLRPVYLLQAQKPSSSVRLRQIVPNDSTRPVKPLSDGHKTPLTSRGRSSSPPVRLVQINGATRTVRGQSSSPPEYLSRRDRESAPNRRAFVADASSDSSQSIRSSPPRSNWRREFQSAIPVPVSGENRARFRRRHRDLERTREFMSSQPMLALAHHYQQPNGSANISHHPRISNGRTKSPSPTRISVDKFSVSQDSGINHQSSSSGSESSDYCTPPAEPYLPLQTDITTSKPREENFDQSDRSETPSARQEHEEQKRERFINLEDHDSTSDFEDHEEEKKNNNSQDETDFVRTQIYQKLHDEHITSMVTREPSFRKKITEKRLSKSHADLSEVKKFTRKAINSAPLVKHLKALENNLITDRNLSTQNNALDEESKSSQNSSIENINSANQSQTDLRSLSQSQKDLHNINQNQIELRSFTSSQGNVSQTSDFRSQSDLRSLAQSHADLKSLNQSQKDLQNLNQSQLDLQSLNDSLTNLNQEEKPPIKYPEIVRKKSVPRCKVELKRKTSSIPTKVPTMFPDTLRGYPKPREGFSEVVLNLESPEWEQSVRGLQGLVRLVRHHQDTVESQLHTICVLLARHIKNLRSQVARAACLTASEMFNSHKRTLEPELEELVVPLLQRTADTNKFIRADANTALDAMCLNISTSKTVTVLATKGATHHNAAVRCATARLISELAHRLGPNRVFQLPREIRDKILIVGANMLMEGSLETRKHTKSMFAELATHPNFHRAVSEAVPTTTTRHISKILKSL